MKKCQFKHNRCFDNDEFIKHKSFEECLYYAFYKKNGKKYSHQRRVPSIVLDTYKNELISLEKQIKTCKDFDSIYNLFKKHKTSGIGNLTVYDVSLRVGQNYEIYPDKVYLHAGTKKGALNAGLISKYDRKDKLTIEEISAKYNWLGNLPPYLIEDFLCIYKDDINEENLQKYLEK